jgi:hypothetical protein
MAIPISNVTRRVVYAASGTGPYAFTFEILANTDIAVYRDDTLLTLTTNYTVTINSNGTGSITLTAAPTGATQIAIVGNRTIQRTTDFVTGGDFFANTVNDEMDQQTIFAQQNAEGLSRALQAPQTDPTTINMTLPAKATRASKTLTFDADGNPSAGVSAADVANAVTYATNAANSATAAASSASSASSSASAASASASTASTQASNASTSASNASTSASGASTSATNAAASASTATTQASNASTSASNAASSASAASTSASNAATSETNAAASASTASTQASNAATSASNASTSATSAANSAAAAASALDSFDDRYLGTKTSDPTLDNDGNALVAGALYFSTTENVMKVYDGASWITATSAGATSLLRFRYVATSGQTTFSGADAAAATLTYTVNNIAVHRNGVTLDTSEYTASNGTSIVLNVAAGTGDIVDIIAFKSFTVADALSAVSGGTVNGAVTVTGVTTVQAGTASLPAITTSGDTNTGIFFPAADTIAFSEGGVESARINSSGNLGIGVTSPATKLDVSGVASTNQTARFVAKFADTSAVAQGNGGGIMFRGVYTGTSLVDAAVIHAYKANATDNNYSYGLAFTTRANGGDLTANMRLDENGNMGLGVTPSAWYTGYKAFQLTGDIGFASTGGALRFNNYLNTGASADIYYGNGWAGRYRFTVGNHIWDTAASGTAGGTVSFTSVMTLDASGNLQGGGATVTGGANNIWWLGTYNNLTAAAANMVVASNGSFQRSTSASKYKKDIRNLEAIDISKLRPVRYKSNLENDDQTKDHIGFIADEISDLGLIEIVNYGETGEVEGLQYERITAILVKAMQEQQAIITSLTDRITALENT